MTGKAPKKNTDELVMGIMKRIFTDHEIFLEDRGYINEGDYETFLDDASTGIVSTDDEIECKEAKRGGKFKCTLKAKAPQFTLKKEKIDSIDVGGLLPVEVRSVSLKFNEDQACSVITPKKGRIMQGRKLLVCKEIGGL